MQIHRRGAYRNRGRYCLASEHLANRSTSRWTRAGWDSKLGKVDFVTNGSERGANYRYEFTFTADDLIWLLGTALPELDVASRAVGSGALASLRALLVPKETPQGTKFPAKILSSPVTT